MSSPAERLDGTAFRHLYDGRMVGILRWPDLEAFWTRLRQQADEGWYIYAVGEPPPVQPAEAADLVRFVGEIDVLLRREHNYDYCGIVYADDVQSPSLIKIFDPNHLGSSCGSSGQPTPPGWVISKLRPVDLSDAMPLANNRRRWWERLFG